MIPKLRNCDSGEIDFLKVGEIGAEITNEFLAASVRFSPFASEHEGFAILKEEVDELWDAVKLNQKHPERLKMCRKEAIQIAAMALHFVYDCVPEKTP